LEDCLGAAELRHTSIEKATMQLSCTCEDWLSSVVPPQMSKVIGVSGARLESGAAELLHTSMDYVFV